MDSLKASLIMVNIEFLANISCYNCCFLLQNKTEIHISFSTPSLYKAASNFILKRLSYIFLTSNVLQSSSPSSLQKAKKK